MATTTRNEQNTEGRWSGVDTRRGKERQSEHDAKLDECEGAVQVHEDLVPDATPIVEYKFAAPLPPPLPVTNPPFRGLTSRFPVPFLSLPPVPRASCALRNGTRSSRLRNRHPRLRFARPAGRKVATCPRCPSNFRRELLAAHPDWESADREDPPPG